jgi:hypothetical protein
MIYTLNNKTVNFNRWNTEIWWKDRRIRGAGATGEAGAVAPVALTVRGQCGGNWLPLFVTTKGFKALTNKLFLLTYRHMYKYILWPRSFHGSFTHYAGYTCVDRLVSYISLLHFSSFLTHLNFCSRLAQSCSGTTITYSR